MLQIKREGSKENFLDMLYNDFGFSELAISYNYVKDGETCFSKWVKYSTLMHLDWDDAVPNQPFLITKQQFINKASHRSILDVELLFDIDDTKWKEGYTFMSIESKAIGIYNQLKDKGVNPIAYHSGGKGYHISVVLPQLKGLCDYERREIKSSILKFYKSDLQKACSRVMISMELEPHRKSGKIKCEVRL